MPDLRPNPPIQKDWVGERTKLEVDETILPSERQQNDREVE